VRRAVFAPLAAACFVAAAAQQPTAPAAQNPPQTARVAQRTQAAEEPIATVPIQGVSLSGSLIVADGRATMGNNSSITAGDQTAHVALTRGGTLDVCSTTSIHLATDNTTPGGALMIAIDRGAFEAHYTPGEYSDVILTPDLRILISPPGQANLSLRVNQQGDTCVDNHGDNAPYVLATNLFSGGAYRIQPNQRVLFEHGSLNEVVDNETEPCGCPATPTQSVAAANPSHPGARPNAAARQNPFPLAQSEGLAPTPPLSTTPAVPTGQIHAEVQVPLIYSGNHATPPPPVASPAPTPASAATPKPHRGFFGHIGHFFARIFGG